MVVGHAVQGRIVGVDHQQVGPRARGDAPAALGEALERELAASPWSTHAPVTRPFAGPPLATGPFGQQVQDTEQVVLMLGAATVPLAHPDALAP